MSFETFLLVRLVVRRHRPAVAVVLALWTFFEYPKDWSFEPSWMLALGLGLLAFVLAAILITSLIRFGLLCTFVTIATSNLLLRFPVSIDFDRWHSNIGMLGWVCVLTVALHGFRYGTRQVEAGKSMH